jgi:tetratricopeptide (TPR) repeat protein
MSDILEPMSPEEDEEFDSLFRSLGGREAPEEPEEPAEEEEEKPARRPDERVSFLDKVKKRLESWRGARQEEEEGVNVAPPSLGEDFTISEEPLDIEAAREEFLFDVEQDEEEGSGEELVKRLEEEEPEEEPVPQERRGKRTFLHAMGFSTPQVIILGVLGVMVIAVYAGVGIIVTRTLPSAAEEPPLPEEPPVLPAPTQTPTVAFEEEVLPTATPSPVPTPRPEVSTNLDLRVLREPENVDLRVQRGEEYLRLRAYSLAFDEFEYALSLEPERADAYVGLGRALLHLHRWQEAEEALGTAIAFDEEMEAAHFWLGRLYYLQGRYEEAAAEFDWAAEINPTNPRNEAWLALAAAESGDLVEGSGAAQRALDLDEEYPLAHLAMARVREKEGNIEGAQGELLYARNLAPYDFRVLNALARFYAEHVPERLGEAEQLVQRALNWTTWDIEEAQALHTLGKVYLAQGNKEQAAEVLAEASGLATVDGQVVLPGLIEDLDRAIAP